VNGEEGRRRRRGRGEEGKEVELQRAILSDC
jgi:hypothetical protein